MKKVQPLKYKFREETWEETQWFPPSDPRHNPEETPVKEIQNQCPYCGNIELGDIYVCNDETEQGYNQFCVRVEEDGYCILTPGCHILKSNFSKICMETEEEFDKHFTLLDI